MSLPHMVMAMPPSPHRISRKRESLFTWPRLAHSIQFRVEEAKLVISAPATRRYNAAGVRVIETYDANGTVDGHTRPRPRDTQPMDICCPKCWGRTEYYCHGQCYSRLNGGTPLHDSLEATCPQGPNGL